MNRRTYKRIAVGALAVIGALYGCSSVMVCCSEGAKVESAPTAKVNRQGGTMAEDVIEEAVKPAVPKRP